LSGILRVRRDSSLTDGAQEHRLPGGEVGADQSGEGVVEGLDDDGDHLFAGGLVVAVEPVRALTNGAGAEAVID
ncbi:MAG: hypothetical protein K8H87_11550, partial [Pseudorhodoplanes sp.]|nr:hypothetical protein [Pseudorhodoplanes sp.]